MLSITHVSCETNLSTSTDKVFPNLEFRFLKSHVQDKIGENNELVWSYIHDLGCLISSIEDRNIKYTCRLRVSKVKKAIKDEKEK